MRAVLVREFDGPDALAVEDVPMPEPGPGQVRLRVAAAGVSFVDALIVEGRYQALPDLPWIPGSECAGTIDALGQGVVGLAIGDRACAIAWGEVMAEAVCVDASAVVRLPDTMDFDTGAVIRVAATTAWHALVDRAALGAGETLLVLGASGATGHAAVQIGKALGARVIAVASSAGKRADALAAGADDAVDGAVLREAVEALVGRKAVDVVFDPVGGDLSEPAFRLLGWDGRHCVVGFAAGETPALKLNLPLLAGAAVLGVNVGRFAARFPDEAAANMGHVLDLYRAGHINPRIAHRFPIERAVAAFACARTGRPSGRVVIRMNGE